MKPPAFQFYVDDFLGGTMHFTDAEVGLYMRLLCVQWSTGGLTDNDEELLSYGKPGANPTLFRVKAKFKRCEDGLLRNERMEHERVKQVEYRLRQAENGRRGGRPGKATENPTLSQPKPESKPDQSSPSPVSVSSLQSTNQTPLPPKGEDSPLLDLLESEPTELTPTPKPKSPLQLRAERLMRRRESTPWTHAETRAFKKNQAAIEATTDADWQALERFYAAPQSKTFARKEFGALLNNWNGEIDKAKQWLPAGTYVAAFVPEEPPGWQQIIDREFPKSTLAYQTTPWAKLTVSDRNDILTAVKPFLA